MNVLITVARFSTKHYCTLSHRRFVLYIKQEKGETWTKNNSDGR